MATLKFKKLVFSLGLSEKEKNTGDVKAGLIGEMSFS